MVRLNQRLPHTRATPIYGIGAVSRLTGIPIWTLRWIERHRLVRPRRTDGNQRLFSDDDIELLQMIRDLMEQRVNLAGIRVVLRMRVEQGAAIRLPSTRIEGSRRIRRGRP